MNDYLKIKCVSLAEEAKLIRKQEYFRLRKALECPAKQDFHMKVYNGLSNHRKGVVRGEARSANIAYGFVKGHPYREIEATCRSKPHWKRVYELVSRYGNEPEEARIARYVVWKAAAVEHLDRQAV